MTHVEYERHGAGTILHDWGFKLFMGLVVSAGIAAVLIFALQLAFGHIGRKKRNGPDHGGTGQTFILPEFAPLVRNTGQR